MYSCKTCGKKYTNKHGRRRHEKVVHEERRYTCSTCGETYRRQEYLVRHERAHRPKPTQASVRPKDNTNSDLSNSSAPLGTPVCRISTRSRTNEEPVEGGTWIYRNGKWYGTTTVHTVGLSPCDPPPGISKTPQTNDQATSLQVVHISLSLLAIPSFTGSCWCSSDLSLYQANDPSSFLFGQLSHPACYL